MARTAHGFCTTHRIAYDRRLDPTCPQCSVGRMGDAQQLDYDKETQRPVDQSGAQLDAFTLQPIANK